MGGTAYPIRWDYRPILDICTALSDPELSEEERAYNALDIFYPSLEDIPQNRLQEAIERCIWFIDCGDVQTDRRRQPRLMDWEQDFPIVAAPVNRVLGREIRSAEPLHWWSFIGAYQEIGECTFAQVVRIRDHLARGKKLDTADMEWYRRNRHLVEFKNKYTNEDDETLKRWGGA